MRVKSPEAKKHRKVLKLAKGYHLGRHNLFREAQTAVIHAGVDAYRGRKEKKQQFRALWIVRLSAALKPHNISYSKFIHQLNVKSVELDRKVLSQIALEDPKSFDEIVKKVI